MPDLQNLETLAVTFRDVAAYVTLNRPEVRNAMNYQMVEDLYTVFTTLRDNRAVRAIVLRGAEGTFCSGGDIREMRENPVPPLASGGNLDRMLSSANEASQVIIAQVEGAALGGGLGLVCVSDIAIADRQAQFGLPEVRLGVAPSFISPYVLDRMGLTRARELMLTGRRFNGDKALEYGLVHEVCEHETLEECVAGKLDMLRKCAPGAIAATKELIFTVLDRTPADTVAYRAALLDRLRTGPEAQEGLLAFIEKRPAPWAADRSHE